MGILLSSAGCKVKKYSSNSFPIEHAIWDQLVKKHVTEEGWVDYPGFIRDSSELNEYLQLLESNHPNDHNWGREERLAYWINAYNAFTVKLIVDHYPVESIKDIRRGIPFINTVWDIKFIEIEEMVYDLNNIEHGIIRERFEEPRIHFAVNCASVSCPRLRNEAYTAEKLDAQLTDQAYYFLSNPIKNKISPGEVALSKLFFWYKGDFTKEGSVLEFVDRYTEVQISANAKKSNLPYNWQLNELKNLPE